MPETITNTILADCAAKILEGMFFASISEDSDPPVAPSGPLLGALVTFTGPHSGSLAIAAPADTVKTMAVDFLGLSPDDPIEQEKIEDTLGELANMVCGSTVSRFDDEGLFSLAHPTCGDHAVEMAMSGDGVHMLLDIGEGTLALCFKVENAR